MNKGKDFSTARTLRHPHSADRGEVVEKFAYARSRKSSGKGFASILLMKKGVQIAGAMEHADNLYVLGHGAVKDDVPAYGKAPQPFGQFFTRSAHMGPSCKGAYFSVEKVNKGVRSCLAVIRDVIPNLGKVAYGAGEQNNRGHFYNSLLGPRAALLLRPRCLISSGFHGVGSPLSSPSRMSCLNCSSFTARAWSCCSIRRSASRTTSLAEA